MDYAKFIEEVREREAQIGRLRKNGLTLQEIGDRFEISAERVRQILARQNKERKTNPADKGVREAL